MTITVEKSFTSKVPINISNLLTTNLAMEDKLATKLKTPVEICLAQVEKASTIEEVKAI